MPPGPVPHHSGCWRRTPWYAGHEDKDVEPDPAGAEAGAPREPAAGRACGRERAWGARGGVSVVVLLVVVVEIRVVELLVVGFGGFRLFELLLLRLAGDPLHTSQHLVFWPLGEVSSNPANG